MCEQQLQGEKLNIIQNVSIMSAQENVNIYMCNINTRIFTKEKKFRIPNSITSDKNLTY